MSWSRGSTPNTLPSLSTRRHMPHWTPQKEQCVGTSRSPARVARQCAAGSPPASPRKSPVPGGSTGKRRLTGSPA
jgi:hypothetical protein